ncbi:MAG TPA: thiaminase II [Symbiobacteriaceae bacterium]
MGFYAEMRQEADPIFQAIFSHPFVVELTSGRLAKERWAYYLCQDYQYLTDLKQAVGVALVHLRNLEEIAEWERRINAMVLAETRQHLEWGQQVGLTEEQMRQAEPDPAALAYRQHTLLAAYRGIGPLCAALVPCPTTYMEIADRVADRIPDHPVFGKWVRIYSARLNVQLAEEIAWWTDTLDRLAAEAGTREREEMRRNFIRSCKYEWMFWEMAYRAAGWPV